MNRMNRNNLDHRDPYHDPLEDLAEDWVDGYLDEYAETGCMNNTYWGRLEDPEEKAVHLVAENWDELKARHMEDMDEYRIYARFMF